MTTNDPFERRLEDWLEADSAQRVPGHLDAVLLRTVATRQRPGWSSLERWLPMTSTVRDRMTVPTPILWFAVLAALVLAVVGSLLLSGAVRLVELPPGLADNGRIYVADGAALTSYAADGTDPRLEADLPATAVDLSFSPDGRYLAIVSPDAAQLRILDVERGSSSTLEVPGMIGFEGPVAWSPDGQRFIVEALDGTDEHLVVAAASGEILALDAGIAPAHELQAAGWSARGDRIAVVSVAAGEATGTIEVLAADGSAARTLAVEAVVPGSVSWSPDPASARLLYVRGLDPLEVRLVDVDTQDEVQVGPGQWPVWSPVGDRIALWDRGTQIVSTAAVLAGPTDPNLFFPQPVHTQAEMAPLPGRYTSCDNSELLYGTEICGPVTWSPDGQWIIGPKLGEPAVVFARVDGTGIISAIDLDRPQALDVAWARERP